MRKIGFDSHDLITTAKLLVDRGLVGISTCGLVVGGTETKNFAK